MNPSVESAPAAPAGRPRRTPGRLSLRLLAFNLLLVFIPAAGLFYLDTYEKQLLEAQERSMVQQGRVLSAAFSGRGPLSAEAAEAVLKRLNRRLDARLRVLDADGRVLGDTSRLGPRQGSVAAPAPEPAGRRGLLYRAGALFHALYRRIAPPPEPAEGRETARPDGRLKGREIDAALAGRYGKAVRTSPGQRSVTFSVAIPIVDGGRPVGAVLVSQSTYRILQDLYAVRLGIFEVCLASLAAAVVVSLLLSATIARPLRQLRDEAEAILDRRGRLKGSFRPSLQADEIGDLSRALNELTRRLEGYQSFLESFAADVSHEFKNPLASIRTAAEMLSETEDPEQRRRFLRMAQAEVVRMERLLTELSEVTRIDARLETEGQEVIALNELLQRVCEGYRLRGTRVRFLFEAAAPDITVRASADRLARVFENLLDNAASFSPEGGTVLIRLDREQGAATVSIADAGPGIPPEHFSRIFERFFTWRPEDAGGVRTHTGLGLAIVKTVIEGYGGKVEARNNPEGGATFTVRMPSSRTGVFRKPEHPARAGPT